MKTIPIGLKQALADDGTVATLMKITRKDGVVEGFTNHDIPLLYSGVTYRPIAGLEQVVLKIRNNIEVSNQEFVGAFVPEFDEQDVQNGLYNEALIQVYYTNWRNTSDGAVLIFSGQLGNIQWNDDGFRADIFNIVQRFNNNIGVVVTNHCRHALYSQAGDTPSQVGFCGVNRASFTYTGTVSSISTQNFSFDVTGLGSVADDFINNGILTWTSGNNNGGKYEVKKFESDNILLFLPTTYSIQVGDTFSVEAGCDKKLSTCKNKFNNVTNFGGFPFGGDQ